MSEEIRFCPYCGAEVAADAYVCVKCGRKLQQEQGNSSKSKLVAGLLALFTGTLGIHNFYLGYNGKGIAQLLITIIGACVFIGPFITGIWALIEAILIFTGRIDHDAAGNKLQG